METIVYIVVIKQCIVATNLVREIVIPADLKD
jgi:hypothetical protein